MSSETGALLATVTWASILQTVENVSHSNVEAEK